MGLSIEHICGNPRLVNYPTNGHVYTGDCAVKLASTYYVPVSGYYIIGMRLVNPGGTPDWTWYNSNLIYVDASKPLNNQDMPSNKYIISTFGYGGSAYACDVLKAPDGKVYYLNTIGNCKGDTLPPTPVVNTSCTINSGNALSVSLGSLDRATLPTTPSSGSAQHIKIPVSCTGGDVTVSMNITYTAITIGSTQAVKTSANGVGTAIIYNNAAVTPTSKATINLKSGSNTVDLGFQAIRDSAVAVKDIPTGAFTASAVMVMTQQ